MTAEEIKALRASLSLSLRDFAKRIGATHTSVKRWEDGGSSPLSVYEKRMERLSTRAGKKPA